MDWIVILIFLLALGLRVAQFGREGLDWFQSDVARDMLVSKHINLYGEYPKSGPYASGGHGLLQNSTAYYYFWALIFKICPFEIAIPIVTITIGMATIGLCNLIGNLLLNRFSKYLWLVIITFSQMFIWSSISPSQPGMVIFFGLLVVFGLIKYYRTGKSLWLLWSILGNWLSLEIHYSIFALYPLFILLLVASVIKWRNKLGKLRDWLIVAVTCGFSLYFWMLSTYKYRAWEQINYFKAWVGNSDLNLMSMLSGLGSLVNSLVFDLIGSNKCLFILVVVLVLLIGSIKLFMKKDWLALFFGLGLFCGLVLVSTQLKTVGGSAYLYIEAYYVLFPLYLLYLVEKIILAKYKKTMTWILVLIFIFFLQRWIVLFSSSDITTRVVVNQVVDVIEKDSSVNLNKNISSFNLWHDSGFQTYNFFAVTFWYWLEERKQQRLIKLDIADGNNFYPLGDNYNSQGYLICSNFDGPSESEEDCQKKFINNFNQSYKLNFIERGLNTEWYKWSVYRVSMN